MTESPEGLFEPLSHDEEILEALNNDNPARAAQLLRTGAPLGRLMLRALASMLTGDAVKHPRLRRHYAYRLIQAPWGKPGPKPKRLATANLALLTGDTELTYVLTNCAPTAAAQLLRKRKEAGPTFVTALADLLDGDARQNPSLLLAYPCRLKLVQWNLRGRKPKELAASAKSNPTFNNKLPPRRSHALMRLSARNEKPLIQGSPRPSDAMLASLVERSVVNGLTRRQAIQEAVKHVASTWQKAGIVSPSQVEKAYDRYKGKISPRCLKPKPGPADRA